MKSRLLLAALLLVGLQVSQSLGADNTTTAAATSLAGGQNGTATNQTTLGSNQTVASNSTTTTPTPKSPTECKDCTPKPTPKLVVKPAKGDPDTAVFKKKVPKDERPQDDHYVPFQIVTLPKRDATLFIPAGRTRPKFRIRGTTRSARGRAPQGPQGPQGAQGDDDYDDEETDNGDYEQDPPSRSKDRRVHDFSRDTPINPKETGKRDDTPIRKKPIQDDDVTPPLFIPFAPNNAPGWGVRQQRPGNKGGGDNSPRSVVIPFPDGHGKVPQGRRSPPPPVDPPKPPTPVSTTVSTSTVTSTTIAGSTSTAAAATTVKAR